jgi:hypothetical protein
MPPHPRLGAFTAGSEERPLIPGLMMMAFLIVVLLDRAGRVVWRHAGPFREEDYALLAVEARRELPR